MVDKRTEKRDQHDDERDAKELLATPFNQITLELVMRVLGRVRYRQREEDARICNRWSACNVDAFREQALAADSCAMAIREGRSSYEYDEHKPKAQAEAARIAETEKGGADG